MTRSRKRSCLVLGGSGLIGSYLLRELAAHWDVHAAGRNPGAEAGTQGVTWHHMDLSDGSSPPVLPVTIDAVVYLAQSERFREFPEGAADVFAVNVAAVIRLLEYARKAGARNFVLASSGGIYGTGDGEFEEDRAFVAGSDLGFYASTKLSAELLAASYAPFMNVVALRFFFVYGKGQRRSMLVPRLIDSVRDGRPIALQGSDGIRLNPTYVSDAVSSVLAALELEESYTVNVAGPEVLTLREIGETIGRALGCVPRFEIDHGSRPAEMIGSTALMSELLGGPRVSFSEGIRRVLSEESAASLIRGGR